ncbi:M23 family metallopeptidase, partial [Culicoidibacter larvae]
VTITTASSLNVDYLNGIYENDQLKIQAKTTVGFENQSVDVSASNITAKYINLTTGKQMTAVVGATTKSGIINYGIYLSDLNVGEYEIATQFSSTLTSRIMTSSTEQTRIVLGTSGKIATVYQIDGKMRITVSNMSVDFIDGIIQTGTLIIQGNSKIGTSNLTAAQVSAKLVNTKTEQETPLVVGATTVAGKINYGLDINKWTAGEYEILLTSGSDQTWMSNTTNTQKTVLLDASTNKIAVIGQNNNRLRVTITTASSLNVDYLNGIYENDQLKIQAKTTVGFENQSVDVSASNITAKYINLTTGKQMTAVVGATTKSGIINYGIYLSDLNVGEYEIATQFSSTLTSRIMTSSTEQTRIVLGTSGKIATVYQVDGKVKVKISTISSDYYTVFEEGGLLKVQAVDTKIFTDSGSSLLSASQISTKLINISNNSQLTMKVGATTKPDFINYGVYLNDVKPGTYEVLVTYGDHKLTMTNYNNRQNKITLSSGKVVTTSTVNGNLRITITDTQTILHKPASSGIIYCLLETCYGEDYGGRHNGNDISNNGGATVYSISNGVVDMVGYVGSLGNMVGVKYRINGVDYYVIYAHLRDYTVSAGQNVSAGQILGYVGKSGGQSNEHLHIEIIRATYYIGNPDERRIYARPLTELFPNYKLGLWI